MARPLRIVFLTSIRDVGSDDRNGRTIRIKDGRCYMLGAIEHAVRQCYPGRALHGFMEVVGVITDDLSTKSDYPVEPTSNRPWIHPLDLTDHHGRRIVDRTFRVPTAFRTLPLDDTHQRYEQKLSCETRMFGIANHLRADVIVSDHYMCKIVHLHKWQRVVNLHPAITIKESVYCFRGKRPTAAALEMAKKITPTLTGAELHHVSDEIDEGVPIFCWGQTPVHADDTPEELRYRNYRLAKLPVLVTGMQLYVQQLRANVPSLAA